MENSNSIKTMLLVKGIYKSFGTNNVLKGIDLAVRSGEALALIGGNGAGKSTLMKIIMGLYKADKGSVLISGQEIRLNSVNESLNSGIYMVPQEPLLFPHMTILENVLIGIPGERSLLKKKLQSILEKYGWQMDMDCLAQGISVAQQQIVELLRALLRDANVLILDEPTGALTFDEVETLYKIIDELKKDGKAIIYITHRMGEIFRVADNIAIMRDGQITVSGKVTEFTEQDLIRGLLPDNVAGSACAIENTEESCSKKKQVNEHERPVLELHNYSGYGFHKINLNVYKGEILGIAGVVGAGRTELATTIFGLQKALGGKIVLDGKNITNLSTKEIIRCGINYVTEDRSVHGLFKIRSVINNLCSTLLISSRAKNNYFIDKKLEEKTTQEYIEKFRIKTDSLEQEVGNLSGGNQQKIMLARALSTKPKLIILDEPTRGIDAAARADIYRIIAELKNAGVAIILISSDMEEIVSLSTRAVVICQGCLHSEYQQTEISQEKLMIASFGVD